jgi:hypothetical protein
MSASQKERDFMHGGKFYRAIDNGCYWELHRLDPSGVQHEFTHDDPLWTNDLLAAYEAVIK